MRQELLQGDVSVRSSVHLSARPSVACLSESPKFAILRYQKPVGVRSVVYPALFVSHFILFQPELLRVYFQLSLFFSCNFNVGPFLDILVTIFGFQLSLYAILSICGFVGWRKLDTALNEVKQEYKHTKVNSFIIIAYELS